MIRPGLCLELYMRAVLITVLASLLWAAACDSNERTAQPPSIPTADTSPSATVEPRPPIPGIPPTATPPPFHASTPNGLVLVDVASGRVRPLYEGTEFVGNPGFEDDGSVWTFPQRVGAEWRHFDATGQPLT